MADEISPVSKNLAIIKERIRLAAGSREVTIVGVTKAQSPGRIQEALAAGLGTFGNNYAQEGEALRKQIAGGNWHFIGQIQSRKVKLLTHYACIQSLDRIEIVADLHSRLEKCGRSLDGLIEVNIGEETSKSGISPADVDRFWKEMRQFPRVRCRGLMILPPPLFPVELRRPCFQRAKTILDRFDTQGWDCLSMGTSEDYELAVAEGATMVRLGRVLFGARA